MFGIYLGVEPWRWEPRQNPHGNARPKAGDIARAAGYILQRTGPGQIRI